MKFLLKKTFLLCAIILTAYTVKSQEIWPSPEVEQMYKHAGEYAQMGNLPEAIITYRQAILLAPQKTILYKELGNAFYRSGMYKEAEETLTPLLAKPEADDQYYELLAASQAAQNKRKDARETIKKGMARFPGSGPLYHASGMVYNLEKNKEEALQAWLNGISLAPLYPANYYDASLLYVATTHVEWGLIYAETYLAMPHDTTGDEILKTKLLEGYKTMFAHIAGDNVPQYGKVKEVKQPNTFEAVFLQVYSHLTPVVSDGITTQNLTMVRTRFLMDWFATWRAQYPYSLFSFQDQLLREGYFDRYNEWLFGKAENITEYDAWNKFHEGEMNDFIIWKQSHPLIPSAKDFYNNRSVDFLKKEKK